MFLYTTLCEELSLGRTTITCSDFQSKIKIMRKIHPGTKRSAIAEQFEVCMYISHLSEALVA